MIIRDVERGALRAFHLRLARGEIGRCRFTLRLPPKEADQWTRRAGKTVAVLAEDETPIFYALIDEVAVSSSPLATSVDATALSRAVVQKEKIYRRLFQKAGKKYGDFLTKERLETGECDLELDKELKKLECGPLILQAESNYDFIRRLAAATGRGF